jgi:hypothetical protein
VSALTEVLTLAGFLKGSAPWLTTLGVAYLVVADRVRARRLTALERRTTILVSGHTNGIDAHRNLATALQETPANARHH